MIESVLPKELTLEEKRIFNSILAASFNLIYKERFSGYAEMLNATELDNDQKVDEAVEEFFRSLKDIYEVNKDIRGNDIESVFNRLAPKKDLLFSASVYKKIIEKTRKERN